MSHEHHEHHHDLIAERKAAYDALPKTAAARIRRREADKKAWWTLTGHLRCCHGVRGNAAFLTKTWAEAAAMHDRFHSEREQVS